MQRNEPGEPEPRTRAEVHYWLERMDLDEIDEALRFVGLCHYNGTMEPREALEWRWKILACWAELQRKPHSA